MSDDVEMLEGETCPACGKPTLTLMEKVEDVPFFGITHIFSMECGSCDYGMADLEAEEPKDPVKVSYKVTKEEDLNARVVKSASATVKIPRMVEISPGPDSSGYITTVEGLLNRFREVIKPLTKDDDKSVAKKAKNQLKKLQKVLWGQEELTINLEDPTGNSAIISQN